MVGSGCLVSRRRRAFSGNRVVKSFLFQFILKFVQRYLIPSYHCANLIVIILMIKINKVINRVIRWKITLISHLF
jgi:hypothetical protein